MAEIPTGQRIAASTVAGIAAQPTGHGAGLFTSFREIGSAFVRRRRFVVGLTGGLLAACALYCLLWPKTYEACARVALRTAQGGALELASSAGAARFLAAPDAQLETLANMLRSDQVAWRVVANQRLYEKPEFAGADFARRFPQFRPDAPQPEAQARLLDHFQRHLLVRTLPRTFIVQIRFRSKDAALAAAVANAVILAYEQQQKDTRIEATTEETSALGAELRSLKTRVDADNQKLIAFQKEHGLVDTPEMLADGASGDVQHNPTLVEIDALGRELVAAKTDRILRETEYESARHGNPEAVLASDVKLQIQNAGFATAVLQRLHTQRSALEQEESQLRTEHGPNYPRIVEIRAQLMDIGRQIKREDAWLTQQFHDAWRAAMERERLVQQSLEQSTLQGMKVNSAAAQYAAMRQEADRNQQLYLNAQAKAEEAGLDAGIGGSNIMVVDYARQPVQPMSPNWPADFAITCFLGLWLSAGGVFLLESRSLDRRVSGAIAVALLLYLSTPSHAQAPTPSTSGLPSGVAHLPPNSEMHAAPNAKDAPITWTSSAVKPGISMEGAAAVPMAASIGPGDLLETSEYQTPEFHAHVRVSAAGMVTVPLIGDIKVTGMDEESAAEAMDRALVAKGMLLHPEVTVLVTEYAGQDVTVLGEVARPGVYPYAVHHRVLDLISTAAGLTPAAGSLVTVTHRDGRAPQAVVLRRHGALAGENPELQPGDTIEVQKAGLVYVIGDVLRPGGFPVDPSQRMTVVQALTLAWGPSPNAALGKALLIREQNGGRTVTTLNIKRLLRGQDPDLPVEDRDILFVPDSAAKNLWNRTMESVVQSAAGVSIYAGLVYSQRF
ncbi:MAG TPA: SLBB domain-containing protein [Terracidiphilus sp.]|nr:SLBB domain-containing protein [Terracidiphilus sp.]